MGFFSKLFDKTKLSKKEMALEMLRSEIRGFEQTLISLKEDEQSLSLKEDIKSSITKEKEALYNVNEAITETTAAIAAIRLVIDEVETSETEIAAEAVMRHFGGVKDVN